MLFLQLCCNFRQKIIGFEKLNHLTVDEVLIVHRIRPTAIRRAVLDIFQNANSALSHAEISDKLSRHFDRVTIYRTLNRFLENGLIHKVVDESNIAKFAPCDYQNCDIQNHHDEHVHFKCSGCERIFCLSSITITLPPLPSGYRYHSLAVTAEGICGECSINQ